MALGLHDGYRILPFQLPNVLVSGHFVRRMEEKATSRLTNSEGVLH